MYFLVGGFGIQYLACDFIRIAFWIEKSNKNNNRQMFNVSWHCVPVKQVRFPVPTNWTQNSVNNKFLFFFFFLPLDNGTITISQAANDHAFHFERTHVKKRHKKKFAKKLIYWNVLRIRCSAWLEEQSMLLRARAHTFYANPRNERTNKRELKRLKINPCFMHFLWFATVFRRLKCQNALKCKLWINVLAFDSLKKIYDPFRANLCPQIRLIQ